MDSGLPGRPTSGDETRLAVWVTVGLHDEPVRELMGYSWSARDAWLHRRSGQGVNLAFKLLPRRRRLHPRAQAGWDRAEGPDPGRCPAGAHPGAQPAADHRSGTRGFTTWVRRARRGNVRPTRARGAGRPAPSATGSWKSRVNDRFSM